MLDEDAQKETIKVRKSVFIPFVLMRLVLDKDLSPRDTFLLLEATITAGKLTCCQDILDFIRVAGTLPTATGIPLVARDTAGPPAGISVNRALIKFLRIKVLERDLEGTRKSSIRSDPMLKQLANAVTTFTDIHLQRDAANEAKLEAANEPKKVEDLFQGSKYRRLLNILQLSEQEEDQIPMLYLSLSNKKKKQTLQSIFQQNVDDHADRMSIRPPFIPLGCAQPLVALQWQGIDQTDLGAGVLPMNMVPPGTVSAAGRASILSTAQHS